MKTKGFFLALIFVCAFFPLNAEEIIYDDNELESINKATKEQSQEMKKEEKFVDRTQKVFFNPKRIGDENTRFITYQKGVSYKIRTREAMATSLVFENDKIAQVINGDPEGFQVEKVRDNVIAIKPKILGVDTNITIIGTSSTIYNFYVFSTNLENRRNPTLLAYIKNPKIDSKESNSKEVFSNPLSKFYKLPEGRKLDEFMIIGDNSNRLLIDRKSISPTKYEQIAKAKIKSKSGSIYIEDKESKALKAIEIFNDNEFTYFKFNRDLASSRFPAVFQVMNGINAIVNVSVVGDYLIAKTIADEWVFKEGENEVHIKALR